MLELNVLEEWLDDNFSILLINLSFWVSLTVIYDWLFKCKAIKLVFRCTYNLAYFVQREEVLDSLQVFDKNQLLESIEEADHDAFTVHLRNHSNERRARQEVFRGLGDLRFQQTKIVLGWDQRKISELCWQVI